jgi:putative protease
MERLRGQPKRWILNECKPGALAAKLAARPRGAPADAHLIVLVRDMAQLGAAMAAGSPVIYCEFEDPKKYREAVACFRARQSAAGAKAEIFVAPPRIFKTGEEWILKQVRSCEADGYLLRNYDHLQYFATVGEWGIPRSMWPTDCRPSISRTDSGWNA